MTVLQAFFLGALQGLTEFLPVSSSGHLVIAEYFLDLHFDPLVMTGVNVLLHAGTLVALLLLYWKRWYALCISLWTGDVVHQRIFLFIVIATVPAVVIGLLFEDAISTAFSSVGAVSVSFLLTGIILLIGEQFQKERRAEHLTPVSAFLIGIAQACALLPGLSRSGLTMSAGKAAGLQRQEALDFSFLMLMPILAGAIALTFVHIAREETAMPDPAVLSVAFITSAATSVLAVLFLRRFVQRYSVAWFSLYLFVFGGVLLFFT